MEEVAKEEGMQLGEFLPLLASTDTTSGAAFHSCTAPSTYVCAEECSGRGDDVVSSKVRWPSCAAVAPFTTRSAGPAAHSTGAIMPNGKALLLYFSGGPDADGR